jgi:hypothetical protein
MSHGFLSGQTHQQHKNQIWVITQTQHTKDQEVHTSNLCDKTISSSALYQWDVGWSVTLKPDPG